LTPTIRVAQRRVEKRRPEVDERLREEACAALEHALLERLTNVVEKSLYAEFAAKRTAVRQFGPGTVDSDAENPLYRDFVASKKNDGMQSFFDSYPVAERLCTQSPSTGWRRRASSSGASPMTVLPGRDVQRRRPARGRPDLEANVSDPHDEGRGVILVEFECGTKVVYKPRPIPVEAFYNRFLDWLEARGGVHPLHRLDLVERPTHGWVEFAEHRPDLRL